MRFWQNGGGSTLPFCFRLQCDYFHGCTMNTELKERSAAVYYLSDKDTPLLTLAELAELIEAFTIHLECNKDVLIRTGRYRINFHRSWWLHTSLTNLYYTKMPSAIDPVPLEMQGLDLDPCGHHLPIDDYVLSCYHTSLSAHRREFNEIEPPECGYLEADSFSELDPEDCTRIEVNRAKFYDTKLRVLKILSKAVAHRDSSNIWPDCLNILTETLSGEEAEFFLKMDRYYLGYDLMTGEILTESGLLPGGFTNLLEFIGYCEKEITIGTMNHCKEALKTAGLAFRTEYGQNTWREKEANTPTFHRGTGTVEYSDYDGDARRDQLDLILEQFIQVESTENDFWTEFRSRVNGALREEFREEVTFRTNVRRKFVESFEPNVRSYSEFQKRNQETTGTLAELTISAAALPEPQSDNSFRKEGEYWNITFGGRTIRMKSALGLDHLSYLLRHPDQEVPVLDLRAAIKPGIDVNSGLVTNGQMLDEGLSISDLGNAGEMLDQQAISEYKNAVEGLKEDLDEAEAFNDTDRAARLREQIQFLEDELLKAHGLGGRTRKAADIPDRVRKAVSGTIKRSVSKIEKEHPPLGRHLRNSIKTGRICSYSPDSPTPWDH